VQFNQSVQENIMTPVNPYVHGKPLPHDSEMFFGRRSELDNIISLLSTE